MNESTIQPSSPALPSPTDPSEHAPVGELKYAVINAHTGWALDWVAVVGASKYYGVPKDLPEFWQVYRLKAAGHETILLDADTFYRARIGGMHFGLYIDAGGEIHCLHKKAFERELNRRYQDGAKTVELTCEGNWNNDSFCRSIPIGNLGESRWWLDPQ